LHERKNLYLGYLIEQSAKMNSMNSLTENILRINCIYKVKKLPIPAHQGSIFEEGPATC